MNRHGVAGTAVVTGVSSFLGVHIAAGLANRGYRVIGTVSGPASNYTGIQKQRLDKLSASGIRLTQLDITDSSALRQTVADASPDLWFAHAGWATRYSSLDYDLNMGHAINVAPLTALYEALEETDCAGVIVTGSSAEYSDSASANSESDACQPTLPYGLSKLAQTLRAAQLASLSGIKTRVARIYIPFGPLDAPGKLLSSAVAALLAKQPIDLSACTQARDFVHVDDIVEAYARLAANLDDDPDFDIFNISRGKATELKSLLVEIADAARAPRSLLRFGARPMRDGEVAYSFGDASKAQRVLGWQARPLTESVEQLLRESQAKS